jgi:hypothetical protein
MTPNQLPSDGVAVLATLDPASVAASTVVSSWVPVLNFHSIMALIETGVLGASATLDAKLRQATDASGTGAKDITGKALVQIVKASGDNKQAMINARATDLDQANGFGWVALSVTIGTAASIFGAQLLGFFPRFEPPKDAGASPAINLGSANVVQIVN